MRLVIVMVFAAWVVTNSFGQDGPLDKLTVTSTQFKCLSGYAEVTYGYKRGGSNAEKTELEFVVLQTDRFNSRFRRIFHLNNKVDDVTPAAYLVMEEDTVDLPNEDQVHTFSEGRYRKIDSDVTLAEIRAWLDQPGILVTADSLLEYKAKMRTGKAKNGG